jgi:hypothetical protein
MLSPVYLPYMVIMDLLISVWCNAYHRHIRQIILFPSSCWKLKNVMRKIAELCVVYHDYPSKCYSILKYSTDDISLWQLCLHWSGLASTLYHKSSKTITYGLLQIYILAVHTYILNLCILLGYWSTLSAQNLVKKCRDTVYVH